MSGQQAPVVAAIQITLFPNGQIALQVKGAIDRFVFNGMMETAKQDGIGHFIKLAKQGGIEVPTPEVSSQLIGG